MTDTNLPDDQISVEYILVASANLLRNNPNKGHQSPEQRLESIEKKIDFLLRAVARLASPPEIEKKEKPPVKPRTSAERERKIKDAARKYWLGWLNGERVNGKPITRRQVAIENGFENEPNILSKKIAWDLCMKKIADEVNEMLEAHKGFRKIGKGSKKWLIEFIENATR